MNARSSRTPLLRWVVTALAPACALGFGWLSAGCSSVPVSGRSQLNLVSDEKVVEMSQQQWDSIKKSARLSRDPKQVRMVQEVADRVIAQVNWWEAGTTDWEVIVIDDKTKINAFAMAGGKVAVYTGLLAVVENPDQLAFVLAHEISHVTSKHVHEKLSEQMLLETGGIVASAATISTGSIYATGLGSVYDMGSGYASLTFDRGKEREADYIGLIIMAKAGYDPNEALRVVELVEAASYKAGMTAPPAWLSTHPSAQDRMQRLAGALPEAMKHYEASQSVAAPKAGIIGI